MPIIRVINTSRPPSPSLPPQDTPSSEKPPQPTPKNRLQKGSAIPSNLGSLQADSNGSNWSSSISDSSARSMGLKKRGVKRGFVKRMLNLATPYIILNLLVLQKRIDYDVIFKIADH
jgi:hypothetical protein